MNVGIDLDYDINLVIIISNELDSSVRTDGFYMKKEFFFINYSNEQSMIKKTSGIGVPIWLFSVLDRQTRLHNKM